MSTDHRQQTVLVSFTVKGYVEFLAFSTANPRTDT